MNMTLDWRGHWPPSDALDSNRTRTKCVFGGTDSTYLAKKLTHQGVKPDPDKIAGICNMPVPTTKEGVQRALGMVNYMAKLVKTTALRQLLLEKNDWQWEDEHAKEWQAIHDWTIPNSMVQLEEAKYQVMLQMMAWSCTSTGAQWELASSCVHLACPDLLELWSNKQGASRASLYMWEVPWVCVWCYGDRRNQLQALGFTPQEESTRSGALSTTYDAAIEKVWLETRVQSYMSMLFIISPLVSSYSL